MPYRLIKGEFHLHYRSERHVGSRPDGDSMWFKPDNQHHLENLGDRQAEYNKGGFAQLRFEGIDALELHYYGSNHQRLPECISARDRLLASVGFTEVTYAPSDKIDTAVRTSLPTQLDGYILTRNVDPYGRPVAFVFGGNTSRDSGDECWLNPAWLERSFNAKLIAEGFAYPAYYTGLPTDLRNLLSRLHDKIHGKKKELWKVDKSMNWFDIGKISLLEKYAIWPKLYRRLFKYHRERKARQSFEDWIREESSRDDQLWIISRGEFANMHDIFEDKDKKIKMTVSPEDIVIVPR